MLDTLSRSVALKEMTEKQSRILCLVVGGLLVLESMVLTCIGLFGGVVGTVVGALAIGVGGGSATNDQFAKSIGVMILTLASPLVVAAVLALEGGLLLVGKKGGLIVAAGLLAITAQFAFHPLFEQEFHVADLALFAVQLTAIALAVALLRSTPAQVSIGHP